MSLPPFIPPLLTPLFCFSNYSELFILASVHTLFSVSDLPVNSAILLTHVEVFVQRSRTLNGSLCSTSFAPSALSSSPSPCPSLLSSSPIILPSSVQLQSNPGRQQDLELTGGMRCWNGMTSVVQTRVFVPLTSHLALIKLMSTCVCSYDSMCCCHECILYVCVATGIADGQMLRPPYFG